ncbi:MAG: YbaB/EbfC family nucleoid-associated protein [Clostridia bacterium]|nr:YbaB/EbfC family nucleoid-associated protein [Clostridia bacterium]
MRANIPKQKGMGMNNQAAMLQQVQKMQEDMAAKQAELEEREYEISAGGGAVTVKINGKKEIVALDIEPEIVDPDDIETLSDILVAGINQAIKQVEETSAAEMEKITGSLGLPGMGGFPGLF